MDIKSMKHPDKLTRTILQYPGMILRLHVKLNNGDYHFHNNFTPTILDINISGFLTLEVPKNETNMNNRSFMIGIGNIGTVVNAMKRVLTSIYKQPMFVKENNKLVLSKDLAIKYREIVTIPRLSQAIQIIPDVIMDSDETSYEGVHIYINNMTNIIKLSIDEFENFIYVLEKSDITTLSQLLLNYYISFITDDTLKASKMYNNKTNIFETKTISNFRPNDDNNVFTGLN